MIWCDLDNTLIWTWAPLINSPLLSAIYNLPFETKPPRGRGRRIPKPITVPGLGTGFACSRRSVRKFLGELRNVGPVRMLTSATRPYAFAMNEMFEFGFARHEMVCREDWRDTNQTDIDTNAVLIDNAPQFPNDHDHWSAQHHKLRYLGITRERVVEVTFYRGTTVDSFEARWPEYVARVRRAVAKA